MRFSQLISSLEKGNAGLQDHQLGNDPEINNGASLEKATQSQLSFLEKISHLSGQLSTTNAGAVLIPSEDNLKTKAQERGIAWATFTNPRLGFAEALEILNPKTIPNAGVHPSAVIEADVQLEEGVHIGAHVFIDKGSVIKANCVIHPGVVIYEGVVIGEGSELHANSVVHRKSSIGKKCVIHSNAVIGSEGFGFVPTKGGWTKMPQTGVVIIEDLVEIGCSSSIDRPAVGETRIGEGTKIDNLVQIGHGVTIGKGCAMASQVGVAGGAKIGNGVILAGQVGVANRVEVGSGVIASSKCGIHTDIAPGEVISGFPAIPNRLWLRCSATFRRLPEIAKSLKDLNRDASR